MSNGGIIMNKKIIPVKVTYTTSLEKWKSIRRFAELNRLDTSKIDAMIERIETRGDASLKKSVTFRIDDLQDFRDSIYASFEHPCPHCSKYSCGECPLDDTSPECCKAWSKVKKQIRSLKIQ